LESVKLPDASADSNRALRGERGARRGPTGWGEQFGGRVECEQRSHQSLLMA
jgi:hypothetical protein